MRNKNDKIYSIDFYSTLPENKKSWREIRNAMRIVERVYKRADKRLRKAVGHMMNDYPNNHRRGLKIFANVDKENIGPYGGVFLSVGK
jgi:hypothetical protein